MMAFYLIIITQYLGGDCISRMKNGLRIEPVIDVGGLFIFMIIFKFIFRTVGVFMLMFILIIS